VVEHRCRVCTCVVVVVVHGPHAYPQALRSMPSPRGLWAAWTQPAGSPRESPSAPGHRPGRRCQARRVSYW
jgi:hypothetical protein